MIENFVNMVLDDWVVRATSDFMDAFNCIFRIVSIQYPKTICCICRFRQGATSLTEARDADPAYSHNRCMLGRAEECCFPGLDGLSSLESEFAVRRQTVGDLCEIDDGDGGKLVATLSRKREGTRLARLALVPQKHQKARKSPWHIGVVIVSLQVLAAIASQTESGHASAVAVENQFMV